VKTGVPLTPEEIDAPTQRSVEFVPPRGCEWAPFAWQELWWSALYAPSPTASRASAALP
jgi:hypothetical protein